jgi:hypothetical protein
MKLIPLILAICVTSIGFVCANEWIKVIFKVFFVKIVYLNILAAQFSDEILEILAHFDRVLAEQYFPEVKNKQTYFCHLIFLIIYFVLKTILL